MQFSGSLTREQFMFHEMRITARLILSGLNESQILAQAVAENLYQYPTEREIKSKCHACIKRFVCISDMPVIAEALANGTIFEAKQAALIAMMCQSRLLAEFMINVIGEKYKNLDMTITRKDMNLFFQRLAEEDETVASWTDATVSKIKTVIRNCLKETEFITSTQSEVLLPVTLSESFAEALTIAGHRVFLPAFNCLD